MQKGALERLVICGDQREFDCGQECMLYLKNRDGF